MLNVSCPFHSRLMAPIGPPLSRYLEENVALGQPSTPWVSNLNAQIVCTQVVLFLCSCTVAYFSSQLHQPADIANALVQSTYSTVRWVDCVSAAARLRPELFIEIGPREVLAPLIRQCGPNLTAVFAGTFPIAPMLKDALG
jgi:malonyl CoA-acyl carrier protein transacylase